MNDDKENIFQSTVNLQDIFYCANIYYYYESKNFPTFTG